MFWGSNSPLMDLTRLQSNHKLEIVSMLLTNWDVHFSLSTSDERPPSSIFHFRYVVQSLGLHVGITVFLDSEFKAVRVVLLDTSWDVDGMFHSHRLGFRTCGSIRLCLWFISDREETRLGPSGVKMPCACDGLLPDLSQSNIHASAGKHSARSSNRML